MLEALRTYTILIFRPRTRIINWGLTSLVSIAFVSCTHPTKTITYPDPNFNSTFWKKDSLGCLNYRTNTYELVYKRESFFIGKTDKFVVQLLGHPSFYSKKYKGTGAIYYVVNCTEIPIPKAELLQHGEVAPQKPTYSTSEATTLVFDMQQGTCMNVRISIP